MLTSLLPGQLVRSLAGRDRGKVFLVLGFDGDKFVVLADGDMRRVEDQKRKNVRHLEPLDLASPELREKLASGQRVTNEDVLAALAHVRQQ